MSAAPRAYRGREPSAPMEAGEVVRLLDLLDAAGIAVWLDGGWGVDALLERQTREHDDLDLVGALADAERLTLVLERAGYELVAGGAPKSSSSSTATAARWTCIRSSWTRLAAAACT